MYKLITILLLTAAAAPALAQWTVYDTLGNPIWEVTNVHAILNGQTYATARNISGVPLPRPVLRIRAHAEGGPPTVARVHSNKPDPRPVAPGESVNCTGILLGAATDADTVLRGVVDVIKDPEWLSTQEAAYWEKRIDDTFRRISECQTIYRKTIDKPPVQFTLREIQGVTGCAAEDLYPPHQP